MNVDSKQILFYLSVIVSALTALGAFAVSFAAQVDLVALLSVSKPELAWISPLLVDGLIVVMALTILSKRLNGGNRAVWSVLMWLFAGLSVALNVGHGLVLEKESSPLEFWLSVVIAALPAVCLTVVTEAIFTQLTLRVVTAEQKRQAEEEKASRDNERKRKQEERDLNNKARRQRDVSAMFARGKSAKEIADKVGVNPRTIERDIAELGLSRPSPELRVV